MSITARMLEKIEIAAISSAAMSRCEHLNGKLDLWSPILQSSSSMCHWCVENNISRVCDHCGDVIDPEEHVLNIILQFEHFGASHLCDNFIAFLCRGCGDPIGTQEVRTESQLVTGPQGTIFLVYKRRAKWSRGHIPDSPYSEKQRATLMDRI